MPHHLCPRSRLTTPRRALAMTLLCALTLAMPALAQSPLAQSPRETGNRSEGCFLGCDTDLDGAQATALMRNTTLDGPGASIIVTRGLEGGFQDRFFQVRMSIRPDSRESLLHWLSITTPPRRGPMPHGVAADWWAPEGVEMDLYDVSFHEYPHGTVGILPDPDRPGWLTAWLFAFQT